jgi:hypothetical protein
MVALEPSSIAVSYSYGTSASNQGSGWFGPLSPSRPSAPPQVLGRTWDFPSGFNLPFQTRQYEPIDFETLRALADTWDLLRLVIETRKDQMARMKWTVAPVDDKFKRPGAKIPDALRTRAAEIEAFLKRPDKVTPWATWLRSLLEDHFVIDAMSIFCERTRAGQLVGLVPMDGATIKRIIDDWGRTPRPFAGTPTPEQIAMGFQTFEGQVYPVAYQQRLKNLPAVNMTTRDLLYRPQNVRPNKAYGFSRVEQVIMTVNIALRRQMFTLQHYTEGNIPEAIAGVPETWNPDQIQAFQKYWDETFSGANAMAARRRMKFVPGGMAKTFITTKEPELKNVFDEWLARVVCFCFSVSPTPFVAQVNRATSESAKDSADEEGVESTKDFIATTVNDVITTEFKEAEVAFTWHEEKHIDPSVQATVLTGYTKGAVLTLNEAREDLGREPYPNPEASEPQVLIATGYVPLDAYQQGQDRAQAIIDAGGGAGPDGGPSAGGLPAKGGKGNPDDNSGKGGGGGKPPAGGPQKLAKAGRPKNPKDETKGSPTASAWAQRSKDAGLTSVHDNQNSVIVYHGLAEGHTAEGYLFVTRSKKGAEFHGTVTAYQIKPGAEIHADTETDMKHTGQQTLLDAKEGNSSGIIHSSDLQAVASDQPRDADGKFAAKGEGLDKLFNKAAAGRRLAPIPFARRATRTAQAGIRAAFVKVFDDLSMSVASQLRDADKMAKAKGNSQDADEIADDLDLSALDEVSSDVIAEIETLRADTSMRALVQVGADTDKLVDQVNDDAAKYAREQSATLVSNITKSTRKMIRDTIADGLEENIGLDEIIKNLTDGGAFSEDRADLIARTEITDANSESALDGYKAARDGAGVDARKEWILGPNPCEICQENADAGPIDLDEAFPSGDDAPSAHPWCECALSPVIND